MSSWFRWLNGALLIGGSFVLCRQMGWQLLLGLWGEQRRSAFFVVLFTSLTALQYGLAVTQIAPPFALNERGTLTIIFWIGAIYWWGDATQRQNRRALERANRKVNWWHVFLSLFKKETWTRPAPKAPQFPGGSAAEDPNDED